MKPTFISSLCPDAEAEVIEEIAVEKIKSLYPKTDVERFFKGLICFYKLKCTKTGYVFFSPSQLMGDGKFYNDLYGNDEDGYYPQWRWAYSVASKHITLQDKILEIGSGGLAFLKKLKEDGYQINGLEINPISLEKAKKMNLPVYPELISEHSKRNKENYTAVVFFEVLEHIYDVNGFLNHAIDCLKKGGKLILSVPNNDSYIKSELLALNLPPHHMGHWSVEALHKIPNEFPLKLIQIYFEPLAKGHLNWYLSVQEKKVFFLKNRVVFFIYLKVFRKSILFFLNLIRNFMKDQTVVAVYERQ